MSLENSSCLLQNSFIQIRTEKKTEGIDSKANIRTVETQIWIFVF